jgi:hypothetical protein
VFEEVDRWRFAVSTLMKCCLLKDSAALRSSCGPVEWHKLNIKHTCSCQI